MILSWYTVPGHHQYNPTHEQKLKAHLRANSTGPFRSFRDAKRDDPRYHDCCRIRLTKVRPWFRGLCNGCGAGPTARETMTEDAGARVGRATGWRDSFPDSRSTSPRQSGRRKLPHDNSQRSTAAIADVGSTAGRARVAVDAKACKTAYMENVATQNGCALFAHDVQRKKT